MFGKTAAQPALTWIVGIGLSLSLALGTGFYALAEQDTQVAALSSCLERQPMCREVVKPSQQTIAPLLLQSDDVIMTTDYYYIEYDN